MNPAEWRRLTIVAALGLAGIALAAATALLLDVASGDDDGPRIGDHWHAPYEVMVCGEVHPPIAEFEHTSGIHTHGDGIMHLHPFTEEGEGRGAAVDKFFKNSGGWVDVLRVPEGCAIDYSDPMVLREDSGIHPLGASFADASEVCNAKPESDFDTVGPDYVPQDGDCIRIVYGPAEK